MEDSLVNNLQSEENGIIIDIHPRKYYLDEYGAHIVNLPDGTIIPILYDVVLTYIPVMRTTPGEINSCLYVDFTSYNSWYPLLLGNQPLYSSSTSSISISAIELININNSLDVTDSISDELSMVGVSPLMATSPLLYQKSVEDSPIYAYVSPVYENRATKSCQKD